MGGLSPDEARLLRLQKAVDRQRARLVAAQKKRDAAVAAAKKRYADTIAEADRALNALLVAQETARLERLGITPGVTIVRQAGLAGVVRVTSHGQARLVPVKSDDTRHLGRSEDPIWRMQHLELTARIFKGQL